MPRDEGGTWGRDSSHPGGTTVAARMLQDSRRLRRSLAVLHRRGDREAARYAEVGVQTFGIQDGQAEAAQLEARARANAQ